MRTHKIAWQVPLVETEPNGPNTFCLPNQTQNKQSVKKVIYVPKHCADCLQQQYWKHIREAGFINPIIPSSVYQGKKENTCNTSLPYTQVPHALSLYKYCMYPFTNTACTNKCISLHTAKPFKCIVLKP